MLELYDHPEELMIPDKEISDSVSANGEDVDKLATKRLIIARSADKVPTKTLKIPTSDDNSVKSDDNLVKSADNVPISDSMADKLADIVIYLQSHPKSPSSSIATLIGLG